MVGPTNKVYFLPFLPLQTKQVKENHYPFLSSLSSSLLLFLSLPSSLFLPNIVLSFKKWKSQRPYHPRWRDIYGEITNSKKSPIKVGIQLVWLKKEICLSKRIAILVVGFVLVKNCRLINLICISENVVDIAFLFWI